MADNSTQDDELYLPRTVINKLIKEMVPNIRVSTDARDLILNCCSEFIHLLASEASDISDKQQKKVISPEHIVDALRALGFHQYVEEVRQVQREYKEQAIKHRQRGRSRLEKLGVPEEELLRQQQQLFEQARLENEVLEQQQALLQAQMGTSSAAIQQLPPTDNMEMDLSQATPTGGDQNTLQQ